MRVFAFHEGGEIDLGDWDVLPEVGDMVTIDATADHYGEHYEVGWKLFDLRDGERVCVLMPPPDEAQTE